MIPMSIALIALASVLEPGVPATASYLCADGCRPADPGPAWRAKLPHPVTRPGGTNEDERRRRLVTRTAPIVFICAGSFIVGAVIGGSGGTSEAAEALRERVGAPGLRGNAQGARQRPGGSSRSRSSRSSMSTPRPRRPPCASRPARPRRPRSTGTTRRPSKPRSTPGPSARSMGAWRSRSTTKASSWMPHLTFPGLAAGEKLDRTTRWANGAAARPRRHAAGRGPGRSAHLPVGRVRAGDRRIGGFAFAKAGEGALRARVPDEHPGRDQRPRAGSTSSSPVSPAGSCSPSRVGRGRCGADPRQRRPGPGRAGQDDDRPERADGGSQRLGGTYGGVAVLDARNGDVLGIAGLAFSNPRPRARRSRSSPPRRRSRRAR